MRLALLFCLIMISLNACTLTRTLRYKRVKVDTKVKGNIALAGCLIKKPLAEWNERAYNGFMHYTLNKVQPAVLVRMLATILDENLRKKITYKNIDDAVVKQYNKEMKDNNWILESVSSHKLSLFDEWDSEKLNSVCLKYLNNHINSDYYLVIYGDYSSYSVPRSSNDDFELVPRIYITVYDKKGNKVYSRLYSKVYTKVPGDPRFSIVWHDKLAEVLYDYRDIVVRDFKFMKHLNDSKGTNLQSLYKEMNKKRVIEFR